MKIYVCAMCGRGMYGDAHPNVCYADRANTVKEISGEEAHMIGIFSTTLGTHIRDKGGEDIIIEFIRDMRYWPVSGEECYESADMKWNKNDQSLADFPNMVILRAKAFGGS